MALSPSLVDIFISSISQVQSQRSGPIGRLLSAKNMVARNFDPGAQPQRIALKQRNGFSALTTNLRLATDGTVVTSTGKWTNPELLTSLDQQPVSICNSVPRVFNGSSWSYYADTRVVTSKLTQDVLHTSNHTIQAPTSAVLNGVTCHVWTETTIVNSLPITGVYISIRAIDGAWLRTPQLLYQDADGKHDLAKVVASPEDNGFYVFFNKIGSGGGKVGVHFYDTNGAQLATKEIDRTNAFTPGYWDVTRIPGGTVNYFITPDDTTTYAGSGNWIFPTAAFLPSAVGGQMTISGDPTPELNGTYTIVSVTDSTFINATPAPASPHFVDAGTSVAISYVAPPRIVLIQPSGFPTSGLLVRVNGDSFAANDGTSVTGPWLDQSGNGNYLTPFKGPGPGGLAVDLSGAHPAIVSSGNGGMVTTTIPSTLAFSELVVMEVTTAALTGGSGGVVSGGGGGVQPGEISFVAAGPAVNANSTASDVTVPVSTIMWALAEYDGIGSVNLYVNDLTTLAAAESYSPTAFTSWKIFDGSTGFSSVNIKVYEAAIWTGVLSGSQRAALGAYLSARY